MGIGKWPCWRRQRPKRNCFCDPLGICEYRNINAHTLWHLMASLATLFQSHQAVPFPHTDKQRLNTATPPNYIQSRVGRLTFDVNKQRLSGTLITTIYLWTPTDWEGKHKETPEISNYTEWTQKNIHFVEKSVVLFYSEGLFVFLLIKINLNLVSFQFISFSVFRRHSFI